MSDLSGLNPTPHAIAVYASRPLSPGVTQHSLPSGRCPLLGPVFHRLDRTSLPGALIRSPRRRARAASAVSRLFSGCDIGAQRMWPRQAPATRREVPLPVSIGDEAVDQTGATSRLQLILTATARAMRGVPRLHVPGGL